MPEENTCETFGNVTFKKFFFFKKRTFNVCCIELSSSGADFEVVPLLFDPALMLITEPYTN